MAFKAVYKLRYFCVPLVVRAWRLPSWIFLFLLCCVVFPQVSLVKEPPKYGCSHVNFVAILSSSWEMRISSGSLGGCLLNFIILFQLPINRTVFPQVLLDCWTPKHRCSHLTNEIIQGNRACFSILSCSLTQINLSVDVLLNINQISCYS